MAIKIQVIYDTPAEREHALKVAEEIQDYVIPEATSKAPKDVAVVQEVHLMETVVLRESFR